MLPVLFRPLLVVDKMKNWVSVKDLVVFFLPCVGVGAVVCVVVCGVVWCGEAEWQRGRRSVCAVVVWCVVVQYNTNGDARKTPWP
jgi:hypothetical protein